MTTTIVGNATIKARMVRKDGNKEVNQQYDTIQTSNIVVEDENDWQMRKLVAWIILEWGWDIF